MAVRIDGVAEYCLRGTGDDDYDDDDGGSDRVNIYDDSDAMK